MYEFYSVNICANIIFVEYENFKNKAEKLGYYSKKSSHNAENFVKNDVGIRYYKGMCSPIGVATCKNWRDELLLNEYRVGLIFESTPELALEYLETLNKTERI